MKRKILGVISVLAILALLVVIIWEVRTAFGLLTPTTSEEAGSVTTVIAEDMGSAQPEEAARTVSEPAAVLSVVNTAESVTKEEEKSEVQTEAILEAEVKKPDYPELEGVTLFTDASKDYFEDALFIGDSRTEGLRLYGDIPEATYFARTGISVNALFMSPVTDEQTGMTCSRTLGLRDYGKIYIMLGVNDLRGNTTEGFLSEFKTALATIEKAQPDATIYIQSIIYVTKYKSAQGAMYNNEEVHARNEALEGICDGVHRIYLDVNEVMEDGSGYLNAEYSGDGLHLAREYYYLWCDYLRSHALLKNGT